MLPTLRRVRGFSLVELLVVIGIIVILISIFVPYIAKVREADHRARCAENLRILIASLRNYAAANKGAFPRVTYDPAHNPNGYVAYTGAASADPFGRDTTVRPNDVTASLWLLVRTGFAKPINFICPSTSASAEPVEPAAYRQRSNFSDGLHLSYSYASPFSSTPGYKLDDFLPADFALLADKNPGFVTHGSDVTGPAWNAKPFDLARANSNNHLRAGENVLYTDGHVSFQPTPYCGVGKDGERDNIYTALSRLTIVKGKSPQAWGQGFIGRDIGPAWERDSYLVPTDQD
ncbi:MAG TPA: prepilin-type N-terminal cleavage/methylation domain-containing protein [Tepidisphaeraceae bacterium]|jgi:prepilin-type N-terminal cleavage/methylation domain-containing protein